MKRGLIAVMCAVLTSCGAQTKIANCKYENVTDVGLIDGKTPAVVYYTEEQGLISVNKKYYVEVGGKQEGPYDHAYDLTFSHDGKTLVYGAEIDGKEYVITNGEKA